MASSGSFNLAIPTTSMSPPPKVSTADPTAKAVIVPATQMHSSGKSKVPFMRRETIKGLLLFPLILNSESRTSYAREVDVGSYLPSSQADPSFVVFEATQKDTPALRAGIVQPYRFLLPPSWKQMRVANILSGNYCQPKCSEPWVEVKFESEKQGRVQVVVSPLIRLTNKANATIEQIGTPDEVIASLGPFVTGSSYDPDELLEVSVEKLGEQTYFKYALETPYALTGTHNLAKATAKGDAVVLFVASANDKQWPAAKEVLKAIVDSFQV